MNIRLILIGILIVFLTGMSQGDNQKKEHDETPTITDLPDLTASIKFDVKKKKKSRGIICYGIIPTFTVINQGKRVAKNFKLVIEWNYTPKHKWQVFSGDDDLTLGAGKSKVYGGNPAWNLPWCSNEKWIPKWRITVDTEEKVAESNEKNNQIVKPFKTKILKAIKRN